MSLVLKDQHIEFDGFKTLPELLFEVSIGMMMAIKDRPDFVFASDYLRCAKEIEKSAKFLRDVRYYAHAVANRENMKQAGVTGRMGC